MRPNLNFIASALFAISLCSCAAQSHPACPTLHIANGPNGDPSGCAACIRNFYKGLSPGTRVYSYDQYVILDGHRNEHFSNQVKMFCDAKGLHAVDPAMHKAASFSFSAKIISWHNAKQISIKPGEKTPRDLVKDVRDGIAHYVKTIR